MPTTPMYLKADSTYYPREESIYTPRSFKPSVLPLEEDEWTESEIKAFKRAGKLKVDEAEYWEKYSENVDENYEWNNGYLEVKPVSDHVTTLMYVWFTQLMNHYLETRQNGQIICLEMAFRLPLPSKTVVRKPDYGIVLHTNPVPLKSTVKTHSYHGICDLCVEALSDSKPEYIKRDTEEKYKEYAAGGVKEYYIVYANDEKLMGFYRLNNQGVYVPIKPDASGLIQSSVLPGFQFRPDDLYRRPELSEMACDPVYEFVFPAHRKALQQVEQECQEKEQERQEKEQERCEKELALQQVEQERQEKQLALQRAEQEHQEKELAQQKVAEMVEQLRKLGIVPDKL